MSEQVELRPPTQARPATDRLGFRGGVLGALVAPAVFLVGVVAYFVVFGVFDMNALTASGAVGILLAGLLSRNYSRFWAAVVDGVASKTSVLLLLVLLMVSLVSALIGQAGVSDGFVWLATSLGVSGGGFTLAAFLIACAIAVSTGTSIGTLFTVFPILYPAGAVLGADPALMAGAILSGALFGDNLAPISDSTIVSASTQRYRRIAGSADIGGVVKARAKYALVAAAIAGVLFLVVGSARATDVQGSTGTTGSPLSLLMLVPIALLLVTAVVKRDIFLATTVGLVSGLVVALASGLIAPADIINTTDDGNAGGLLVTGIADTLPLIGVGIVVFGIIGVLTDAGIFDMIVDGIAKAPFSRTPVGAELSIGAGAVVTATVFAGVNGPSMMMFGPVADRIGARAGLHPYRRANVMDCFTLGLGSIVPVVSSFLLIAALLTQGGRAPEVTALQVFPATFYPLVLTVVALVAVLTGWGRRFEGEGGAPVRTRPEGLSSSVA
ncbi:Na+/H+ antiporter NhaC family protein [Kineococcus sp. SYSU DK003]|uniref:Na+/H+ antiporter NhaC family protein n=1 Tax=Kineococcus sp. SYSU DK003 TaxID=3383124 RepID=UPI003D7D96BD